MGTSTPYGNSDKKHITPEPTWLYFDIESGTGTGPEDTTMRVIEDGVRFFDIKVTCTQLDVGASGDVTFDVVAGTSTILFNGDPDNAGANGHDLVGTLVPDYLTTAPTIIKTNMARSGTTVNGAKMRIGLLVAREEY